MPPRHPHFGMTSEPQHAKNAVATFRRLLGYLRGQRKEVLLLLPGIFFITLMGLAWPSILGGVIDVLAHPPVDWRRIAMLLGLSLILLFASLVARIYQTRGTIRLSVLSVLGMRRELFRHLMTLPVSCFDRTPHGEYMSRLTNDTSMAGDTLGSGLLSFFASCITLIGTFAYMLWLSIPMTVVACITLPLTYFAGKLLVRISRKLYRERQKAIGELNGYAEEMIAGQHTVQAFSRSEEVARQFNERSDRLKALALRAEIVGGFMGPMMNTINNLSFILVAAIGGWLAIHSENITVGTVVAFLLYARQFGRPVNEIAGQFAQIQSAIAGAERVFHVIDEPSEPDEGTVCLPDSVRGVIRFEQVFFRYVEDTPVLTDFSLHIQAGQKVALVGETGSGKTTIISLLARFYDPQSGSIFLDGINLRNIRKSDLRRRLAIVLQDVKMFSGTVAENIAYGSRSEANEGIDGRRFSREQIIKAAKLANADTFIRALPQGYDTQIQQTDTALSQGQCQLLSIARAALSNPAVLILDEATSSVDTRTELCIQEAMVRLLEGRTSIIIAHRLSTIRNSDLIVVLDHGRIVGKGTHKELLASNEPYQRLYTASKAEGSAFV